MTDQDKAKRDELQLIAAREIVSLVGLALALAMLHPAVHAWLGHQAWRLRQVRDRKQVAEDAAVAELQRDISRYEHGEASL